MDVRSSAMARCWLVRDCASSACVRACESVCGVCVHEIEVQVHVARV